MIGGGVALAIAPDFAPPTLGAGYRSGVTDADLDELVRRFVAGDAQALEQVISVHGASIQRFCSRSVGPDHAADVAQETFVAAWRSHHRFEPSRGGLGGWLTGIARNKIKDHLRRRTVALVSDPMVLEPSTNTHAMPADDIDRLQRYCATCGALLHEAQFHVADIEVALNAAIEAVNADEGLRTCGTCGDVLPVPSTPAPI